MRSIMTTAGLTGVPLANLHLTQGAQELALYCLR